MNSDTQLSKIDEKLDNLNNKINFLQDLFLKMKNEFEVIKKGKINEEFSSQLSLAANKQKIHFLKKKAPECNIFESCALMVEQSFYRILRIYDKKGPYKALKRIDFVLKTYNNVKCNDECLKNSKRIFTTLKELIDTSKEKKLEYTKNIITLNENSEIEDGTENEIYNLLTPLSNILRIKILKNLRKGGKTYSQLENQMGIRAGHLLFHLEKLINAGYVTQEKKIYIITINGLKVLKFLFELKEELQLTL